MQQISPISVQVDLSVHLQIIPLLKYDRLWHISTNFDICIKQCDIVTSFWPIILAINLISTLIYASQNAHVKVFLYALAFNLINRSELKKKLTIFGFFQENKIVKTVKQ